MRCRNVRNHTSDYIDGLLAEADRATYVDHLAECSGCRAHLAQTREAVELLRATSPAVTPSDFLERTLAAMEGDAKPSLAIVAPPRGRWLRRFDYDVVSVLRRFVVDYEFKLVAYSVSVVASFLLMVGTLNGLKGVMIIDERLQPTIWITMTEAQVMGSAPSEGFAAVAYTIPKVSKSGGLPQFAANESMLSNDIMVLAEVGSDGRASIVEVLSGPSDPKLVQMLESALFRQAFEPAKSRSRRPVPSRVVLLVQQVDVIG